MILSTVLYYQYIKLLLSVLIDNKIGYWQIFLEGTHYFFIIYSSRIFQKKINTIVKSIGFLAALIISLKVEMWTN